jgi:hypothetical protein
VHGVYVNTTDRPWECGLVLQRMAGSLKDVLSDKPLVAQGTRNFKQKLLRRVRFMLQVRHTIIVTRCPI